MQIDPETARSRAIPPAPDPVQLGEIWGILAEGGPAAPSSVEWLLDRLDRPAGDRP